MLKQHSYCFMFISSLFQCSCISSECRFFSSPPHSGIHGTNISQISTKEKFVSTKMIPSESEYSTPEQPEIKTIAVISGKELKIGSQVTCFYKSKDFVVGWRSSTPIIDQLIFHVMFWPSLLFILGFIGLFFGCVALQHEIHGVECLKFKSRGVVIHTPNSMTV